MKKILTFGMVLILMLSCMALVACGDGGDDEADTQQPTQTDEQTPEETAVPTATQTPADTVTPSPAPTDDLASILSDVVDNAKAAEMTGCFHYKGEMTMPQAPVQVYELWVSGDRMKFEGSMDGQSESTVIIDNDTMIMYSPDMGQAMKFPVDSPESSFTAPENPIDDVDSLITWGASVQGEEVLNGKECVVVKYEIMGTEETMWLWKDYGFPLKVVVEGPTGTVTHEYKEVDFDCAPESVFQLPAGIEVIDYEDMFGDLLGGDSSDPSEGFGLDPNDPDAMSDFLKGLGLPTE